MTQSRSQPTSTRPQDLPVKAGLPRLRVAYKKGDRLAYLGHLEVLTTMERSIRRAGLPVSIGNGFARRMRVQFSQALPVGSSSGCEYLDVRLEGRMDADEALERLVRATPPELAPYRAAYVRRDLPALEAWLNRVDWAVELEGACPAHELDDAIEDVVRAGELRYLRGEKEKVVDLASTFAGFEIGEADDGSLALGIATRTSPAGSLRPQVLLDAAFARLGLAAPEALRVKRVRQAHEENGCLVEPFEPLEDVGATPLS